MKGELDEGRRGGEERRRESTAGRDGNCFDATRKREGKRRAGQGKCKKEAPRHARYAGAYCGVVCMAWYGSDGMAVAVEHPSSGYTVLLHACMSG